MKIGILLCALLFTLNGIAQDTFTLDWEQGVNGGDASFTLAVGDEIIWTWANGNPHSVTSLPGSAENFDSTILTGMGTEFSKTFTVVGSSDYQCDVHPLSMFGTITVEAVMGVEDKFARNVQMYPNPVIDEMTIASLYQLKSYEIHDVYGKKVGWGNGEGNYTMLSTAYLNAGVYFITATSEEGLQTTKKIIKK